MQEIKNFLETNYIWNNDYKSWLISLLIFISSYFILYFFKKIIISRITQLTKKTSTKADDILADAINSISQPFYFTVSVYAGSRYLELSEFVNEIIQNVTMIIVVIYLTIGIQKITMYLINVFWHKKKDQIDIGEDFNGFLNTAIGAVLWTLAIVLVLQNLGYNITALVGGLGVIGIAIAFALQNVLSDLFAYFIIMLDKPFKNGDFIIIGEDMGTVKKIGKKTTRISTLEGQELIISNKELSEARINNYGRMNTRRVVFKIGVTYNTPRHKLAKVTKIIESIIEAQEKAKMDRSNLYNFGDYSLDFETVYFIATPDYNAFMDIQEKINFSIIEAFEKEGIDFAYPTQTILVEKNK